MRIDYALTLPAEYEPGEVLAVLSKLRQFCMDQPFEFVGPIRNRLPAPQDRSKVFDLRPNHVIGFWCLVRPHSTLDLALYRFPPYKDTVIPWAHEAFVTLDSEDPLYTTRHAAIINTLEEAARLGLGVDVEDPCGFQRHHSRVRLNQLRRIMDI